LKKLFIGFVIIILMRPSVFAGGIEPIKPSPSDKCPVCGMFVAKYPDFLADIRFKDGSYVVFDGAKDMFKFYLNMKKYRPSHKPSDIDHIFVTDYYNLTFIDGSHAFYVMGSDIYGPMGRELIPLETQIDAKEFMKDHNGTSILRFREITPEIIRRLD
jgi:copper chaperone NosL